MHDEKVAKYQEVLQRALSNLDARNSAEREAAYDKLRKANEALLEKNQRSFGPEVAAQLRETLETMISDHRRQSDGPDIEGSPPGLGDIAAPAEKADAEEPIHQEADNWGSFRLGNHLIAGVIGAFLGAALTTAVLMTLSAIGLFSTSPIEDEPAAVGVALATAYEANLPEVEAAATFLEQVREEVITRQQNDAAGLTAVAGTKFVKLKVAMAELATQSPKTLPKGSEVILRADATGFKILFNWPLCATVQYARPDLVDPVRARNVLGCSHFGVWNEAGAKW
jgi:hypothetical protein